MTLIALYSDLSIVEQLDIDHDPYPPMIHGIKIRKNNLNLKKCISKNLGKNEAVEKLY